MLTNRNKEELKPFQHFVKKKSLHVDLMSLLFVCFTCSCVKVETYRNMQIVKLVNGY